MKRVLKVKNMSCQHCVKAVTKIFQEVEGISNVEVTLEKGGEVRFDQEREIDLDLIGEKLKKAGYELG